MSVPIESSRSSYVGDGVTLEFSTGFYFLAEGDIKVKLTPIATGVETVLTLGVHYTVDMPAGVGSVGQVVMVTAPAVDDSLVIERDVAFTQDTSFRTQGQFSPSVHEDALDRNVMMVQELARRVGDIESAGALGSVVAGNGLAFSGATLHVGAGDGIIANADDLEVDYGLAAAVADVTKAAASAGTAAEAARVDHKHSVSTAAPVAGAVAAGNSVAEGTATSLARSDHQHAVSTAAPVNVTKATADAGVATSLARSDHKHDVTTAAAAELTDSTNAEGVATSLARSDHTHGHGTRGGGTLHAAASSSTAGFMSAADKAKLDAMESETVTTETLKTLNATPTTLMRWTPTDQTTEEVDLTVVGRKSGAVDSGGYRRKFTVSRTDGATALVGTVDTIGADKETNAAWDITITISSPEVLVQVTGVAATTIGWTGLARRLVADPA